MRLGLEPSYLMRIRAVGSGSFSHNIPVSANLSGFAPYSYYQRTASCSDITTLTFHGLRQQTFHFPELDAYLRAGLPA